MNKANMTIATIAEHFLTIPDEKLVFAKREHVFSVILREIDIFLFSILSIVFLLVGVSLFSLSLLLIVELSVTIFLITISTATKVFINWYFHLYIVSTRRIIEVCYTPLFSYDTNDVILDQVRCTEIDIQMHGFINQILDRGNIVLTFDRPTREDEFTIKHISDPDRLGVLLSDVLDVVRQTQVPKEVWYGEKGKTQFTEEIQSPIKGGIPYVFNR